MQLVLDLVSETKWKLKCPYVMVPEFFVIHNTANDASAKNEVAYMKNNDLETGFHFAVDDVEVRQGIPIERNAFHAGDGAKGNGNRKGIGVEICYSKSGGERFEKAEDNAAKFVAEKLKQFGWGIDRVKKHQDFSGKYCPHRTLDLGWERFLKKVKSYMLTELETVNDIVWELSHRGIITDIDLWLEKLESDANSYWLARKCANYIKENI